MAQMKTSQYNVRLADDLIKRLNEAASGHGRRSGNQVAAEIIEQYLDFWQYAESAKQAVINRQREMIREEMPPPRRGRRNKDKKVR